MSQKRKGGSSTVWAVKKGEIIEGTELCIGADLLLLHSKNGRIKPAEFVFVFTKVEEEDLIFNFVFCLFTQNSLQSDGTPPPCLLQCCFYNKRRYAPLTESSSQNFFKEVLYASAKTFSSAQLLLTNSKIYLIKSVTA